MNPYTPSQLAAPIEPLSHHRDIIAFINLSMLGGLVWILTACIARYCFHLDSPWLPPSVFLAFVFIGSYSLVRAESGWKLLVGTFLIWFPYPIHAGLAACMVSSGLMPIREFVFGDLPLLQWWVVTLLSVMIGLIVTILYLRSSRRRMATTLGLRFVVVSWIGQSVLFSVAKGFL